MTSAGRRCICSKTVGIVHFERDRFMGEPLWNLCVLFEVSRSAVKPARAVACGLHTSFATTSSSDSRKTSYVLFHCSGEEGLQGSRDVMMDLQSALQ